MAIAQSRCPELTVTDIHTYIHAYIHTYIQTYIHKYVHMCIYTRVYDMVLLAEEEEMLRKELKILGEWCVEWESR